MSAISIIPPLTHSNGLVSAQEVLVQPTSFPAIWGSPGRDMLPRRFAIWYHTKKDYQIVDVNRDGYPAITLTPTRTSRSQPYYFASEREESQSRTFTLHRPSARMHTHQDMGIWFTGGWLCRKAANSLDPVIPIMGMSDANKIRFVGNIGLRKSNEFEEWLYFQTPFFWRPILQNRILPPTRSIHVIEMVDAPTAPIPAYVAKLLLEDAIKKDSTCPITMESLEEGDTVVTSCFHLFRKSAMNQWFSTKESKECPVCKQKCEVTSV
jgi:hypothetical protein